jgi:hypothetical protein
MVSKVVKVNGRNDEWTSADVKVQPGDLIIVLASGKVKVGNWTGEVEADGVNGGSGAPSGSNLGRLQMKVGTGTMFFVGKRWFGGVPDPGHLKLRVYDTKYDDNSGSYEVYVLVIPKGVVPQPTRVAEE